MDFASVANRLFASNSESRRRALRLRTYAVIVLTEDCGILQASEGFRACAGHAAQSAQPNHTVLLLTLGRRMAGGSACAVREDPAR